MLRHAVDECPGSLWNAPEHRIRFWQVAYHALFYKHLYLQPEAATFVPCAKHRLGYNELGKSLSWEPYTRDDILEYYCLCLQQVEAQTALLDPDAPSGFHWLPFTKLELQIYDIRHLQHYAGELYDWLGPVASHELDWVAMRHE